MIFPSNVPGPGHQATLIEVIALKPSGNLDLLGIDPSGMSPDGPQTCEIVMAKGNNRRGNKEVKKPKQEKPKALATANSGAVKPLSLGEKKGR